jgi:hypothetical protein
LLFFFRKNNPIGKKTFKNLGFYGALEGQRQRGLSKVRHDKLLIIGFLLSNLPMDF